MSKLGQYREGRLRKTPPIPAPRLNSDYHYTGMEADNVETGEEVAMGTRREEEEVATLVGVYASVCMLKLVHCSRCRLMLNDNLSYQ